MNIKDIDDETKEFIEKVEKQISNYFVKKKDEPTEMLSGFALLSCIVEAKFQITAKTILTDRADGLFELRDEGVESMKDEYTSNIAMGLMGSIMDGLDQREEE